MLTRPDISDDSIAACLRDAFRLRASRIDFLPLGADVGSAAFGVTADDGARFFLKLRRGHGQVGGRVSAFLHSRGIRRVMAPLLTASGGLSARRDDFDWVLYPYFEGKDGYEKPLSRPRWVALGETFRAIHSTPLPAELAASVPSEGFSPRWRDLVRERDRRIVQSLDDDPIAARLSAFWIANRGEIQLVVERAERLAAELRRRTANFVLCHADLHGANVLVGAAGDLTIVDWDDLTLAPRERDLMSVGGGLFGDWNRDDEEAWFYEGYGSVEVDQAGLAYYRYERIVADIAAFADQIFGRHGSAADREQGLGYFMDSFEPGGVVDLAHRSFAGHCQSC